MRPQKGLRADVKRIPHVARRMVGRDIQSLEIVIVGFDFRTLYVLKSKPMKDFFHFSKRLRDRMKAAIGKWIAGKREIDPFLFKLCMKRLFLKFCNPLV